MANTRSAAKRARQITRRTKNNARVLTLVKTQLKAIRAAVSSGKKAEAQAMVPKVFSALDKAAKSGRIHRNKADRHKSDLSRVLATLK
jgi:small subunit ribosomal protein S20